MVKSVLEIFNLDEYTDFEQLSKHGMRPPNRKTSLLTGFSEVPHPGS